MWNALVRAAAIGTVAALAGCAAMNSVTSDVSTYSQWPAGRAPSTYAFERLPSQQAYPERQQQLEDAARGALAMAGFRPADDAAAADVSVQVGARISISDLSPYDDPLWWHGGLGRYPWHGTRFGARYGGGGFGLGMSFTAPIYEREVALLIRDRRTGQALYEARATTDGMSSSIDGLLQPMFEAALKDFPQTGINPRRVTTPLHS